MARHQEHDFDRIFDFARSSLFIQPLSDPMTAALEDDDPAVEPDEPPDNRLSESTHSELTTLLDVQHATVPDSHTYLRKATAPMARQSSLLTEGLLTAANLKDVAISQGILMARAGSQTSAYSLTSNHGLTSDGGMSSPAHTGTPSPPLPPAMQSGLHAGVAPKTRTIKFAGEKAGDAAEMSNEDGTARNEPASKPRKTCISFACPPPKASANAEPAVSQSTNKGSNSDTTSKAQVNDQPRRCTIKFACDPKGSEPIPTGPKEISSLATKQDLDLQTTPKGVAFLSNSSRRPRGSQSTIMSVGTGAEAPNRVSSGHAVSPTEVRKLEKRKKLDQLTGIRPEDEAWMTDEPKVRKPITVSDTLRKENAIRKLAEEASQELDEDYDIDDIVDEEDDEDFPATGSRYMAYDEDESDGGHETDDEEGFAASDDESDDDPDFQFWTATQPAVAPVQDAAELARPHHHRTASESSLDSQFRHDSVGRAPKAFLTSNAGRRRRNQKEPKMRPGTPELPDSTDFVCGTLDEDRPLEEAYLSCIKQRKLEKRGIIPQDLDPSFPTSDPENVDDDEEDEVTEGLASTASDHHFLGGRFDESDASQIDLRKARSKSPMPQRHSPRRAHSPLPKPRFKSPAPTTVKLRAKSPAPPRRLFTRSPRRSTSPAPAQAVDSPPASLKRISFRAPHLAQRNTPIRTASLPHTPNPFFVAHERKMRARARKQLVDLESHNRGPIDIKQGLEARKQRRKEHYWRKHCRDHKDKSRRCAPGKGAERMRELGIEMAHRNRAYGQKLQLMLSV